MEKPKIWPKGFDTFMSFFSICINMELYRKGFMETRQRMWHKGSQGQFTSREYVVMFGWKSRQKIQILFHILSNEKENKTTILDKFPNSCLLKFLKYHVYNWRRRSYWHRKIDTGGGVNIVNVMDHSSPSHVFFSALSPHHLLAAVSRRAISFLSALIIRAPPWRQ